MKEWDELQNEYEPVSDDQKLYMSTDGYFFYNFCREVENEEFMYYTSSGIKVNDIVT